MDKPFTTDNADDTDNQIRVYPCSSVVELISLQLTSFVSFVSFCEKKIVSTMFFTEGNKSDEVVSTNSIAARERKDRKDAQSQFRIILSLCSFAAEPLHHSCSLVSIRGLTAVSDNR